MEVFLLLDQDARPLKVYPLFGKGTKPVEVTAIGNVPAEVEKSFYRAAHATYNLLMKNGGKISHSLLSFEIEEDTAKRIYGGSGALAFAIAAMYEMLGKQCKEIIGATGVIDAGKGTIGKVGAINEKLSTVMAHSPEVKVLFYPSQNDPELSPEVKQEALQRGIKLNAVKTLQDVQSVLFEKDRRISRLAAASRRRVLVTAFIFVLLSIYFAYGFTSHLVAIYFLENEHYALAKRHLRLANWVAFYNDDTTNILRDFETPLETEPVFNLRYSNGREETYPIDRVPPEFRLSGRDTFAFRINPYEPLYVYIIQSEDSTSFKTLYPTEADEKALWAATTIPGAGVFFRLQGKAGNKDIFIVLSRWKCRILEQALSGYGQNLQFPACMSKYRLEEQSVQLKKLSFTLEK
jgi:hypothetical protein